MKLSGLRQLYPDNNIPPPLDEEDLRQKVEYYLEGNDDLIHEIVESFLRLIISIAKGFTRDMEDLISAGIIAAYKAVEKFPNTHNDYNLKPYLGACVRFAMIRELNQRKYTETHAMLYKIKRSGDKVTPNEDVSDVDIDYTPGIEGKVEANEIFTLACRDELDCQILELMKLGDKEYSMSRSLNIPRTVIHKKLESLENRIRYLWQL